jgi:hypothetical protein
MEYRYPPLYYCTQQFRLVLEAAFSFRSKKSKQRTGEESPCIDIELIGKL